MLRNLLKINFPTSEKKLLAWNSSWAERKDVETIWYIEAVKVHFCLGVTITISFVFKASVILFHYCKSIFLVSMFSDYLRLQAFSYSGPFPSGVQVHIFSSLLLFS